MLVSQEPTIVYRSKGIKTLSWLISKPSNIFLRQRTSNSWPVFCFALSPLRFCIRHFSPEFVLQQRATSSAQNGVLLWTRIQQLAEVRDYCLYNFKYGYFSYKNASGGFYSPPGAMWGTFYYGWMHFIGLLLDYWKITPIHCHYNIWNITPNGIVWKKKVISPRVAWGVK